MSKSKSPPQSFEKAMHELEEIVGRMEEGELPLEQLVEDYEKGSQLLDYCRRFLADAETKINTLDKERLKPIEEDIGGKKKKEEVD